MYKDNSVREQEYTNDAKNNRKVTVLVQYLELNQYYLLNIHLN